MNANFSNNNNQAQGRLLRQQQSGKGNVPNQNNPVNPNNQNPQGLQKPMPIPQMPKNTNTNTNKQNNKIPNFDFSGVIDIIQEGTLILIELLSNIVKGILVVFGVLSASFMDVAMGGLSMTMLFGNSNLFGIQAWQYGTALSMGASAIQIFLWGLIQKRGFDLFHPSKMKNMTNEVKFFLVCAGVLWFADTMIDVAPLFLLVQNSQYQTFPVLYYGLVGLAFILTIILCGFAEPLLSNIREILGVNKP